MNASEVVGSYVWNENTAQELSTPKGRYQGGDFNDASDHRTNYWGEFIDSSSSSSSSSSDADQDIPFDVIWVQAVEDNSIGCCPGFGRRRVHVQDSDITKEFDGWWHIFLVNSERGSRNEEHYFYKFIALPQYTPGYGKKGCAKKLGWRWVGEFHARKTSQTLDDILEDYLEAYNESSDIHHVHIGIKMDQLHAPPQQRHTTSGGSTTTDEDLRRRWEDVLVDELVEEQRKKQRRREVVDDMATISHSSSNDRTSVMIHDREHCVVCMSTKKTHLLVPCGHMCVCEGCAASIQNVNREDRKCPICRTVSVQIIKVFY